MLQLLVRVALIFAPLWVYFSLKFGYSRLCGAGLLLMLLARHALHLKQMIREVRVIEWVGIVLQCCWLICSIVFAKSMFLLTYPALVSATFLMMFAHSWFYPPTLIERWVRLRRPELPEAASSYFSKLTLVWIAFLSINVTVALFTAFFASHDAWLFYNGFLSYCLMGLLFVGEMLWRKFRNIRH